MCLFHTAQFQWVIALTNFIHSFKIVAAPDVPCTEIHTKVERFIKKLLVQGFLN